MKKYIRANKYERQTNRNLEYIQFLARNLADVVDADTPEELTLIANRLGKLYEKHTDDKAYIIESILQNLEWHLKEYRDQQSKSKSYPDIMNRVLVLAENYGFNPVSIDDESYRLADPGDAGIDDMNDFCRYLRENMDIKWQEGLGGSWTSHYGVIKGVGLRVGFDYDGDIDPSGKTRTLQVQF